MYNQFDQDENKFMFKISLYDPKYFMPSSQTVGLTINFSPE
jgi:hypothetical protein